MTIYFQSELEVLLKLEMLRQKRPMAEILCAKPSMRYVTREPGHAPPGAGAFASGHADTAERADAVLVLALTGFGGRPAPARQPRRQATTKKKRR